MIPSEFKAMFNRLKTSLLDEIDPTRIQSFFNNTPLSAFFEKTFRKPVESNLTPEDRAEILIHHKWFILLMLKITYDKKFL